MLLYVWFCLGVICLGAPLLYFAYMRRKSSKPWNLKIDPHYEPSVSILIPTYNEEKTIRYKLQNLEQLDYPKESIQVIVVDSASTDKTVEEIEEYGKLDSKFEIVTIKEKERRGKSKALNLALQHTRGEVIIVSDADCFWPSKILRQSLPYLANSSVGAVAGQEKLLNPEQTWVTRTENLYRDQAFKIQLGESKFSSTVHFEGGFGAYDRKVLDQFDVETGSDDSGTALNLIQKGFRTIVLSETVFYTFFPPSWKGKLTIKIRRAKQFVQIWAKCLRLMIRGQLVLPKRIFVPQAFLLLVNPFIFTAFLLTSILLLLQLPILTLLPAILLLVPKTRIYVIEIFQNNFIALLALAETASGKHSLVWKKAEESRVTFKAEVLRKHGLIS